MSRLPMRFPRLVVGRTPARRTQSERSPTKQRLSMPNWGISGNCLIMATLIIGLTACTFAEATPLAAPPPIDATMNKSVERAHADANLIRYAAGVKKAENDAKWYAAVAEAERIEHEKWHAEQERLARQRTTQPRRSSVPMTSAEAPPSAPVPSGSNRAIGQQMAAKRGWVGAEWSCLDSLWTKESGWSTTAANPRSSAYGIPQANPGSKMSSHGADWRTNPATQIAWGLDYIAGRYGAPCGAWSHSKAHNWY